jgi:hypothetical protein
MRLFSLTALAVVVTACEGSDGPAGPAGPPGNANVTSGTFTVAPAEYVNDWWYMPVDGGTQANPAKVATVAVPAITADIVNNGAVLVYLHVPAASTGPSTHWALLPFHQGGFGGGYLVSIKAAVTTGQVRIGYAHEVTDNATQPPPVYNAALPSYEFRYVAIAGVAPAAALQYAELGGPDEVIAAVRRESR